MLVGRERERQAIERAIAEARLGRSHALALVGEPGVGKTALMASAVAGADDFLVRQVAGSEAEQDVPFAGLHAILRPLLDRVDDIPTAQARAIRAALAIDTAPPDRLGAYAGTLSLLAAVAEDRPVLVAVDDAHWIDRASFEALGFTARRLAGESVVLIVAVRSGADDALLAGFERVDVRPLAVTDAAHVLQERWGDELTPAVARKLAAVTGGNPLAMLGVAQLLTERQRAGLDPIPEALPVAESVELSVRRRLRELTLQARGSVLLVAAGGSEALVPLGDLGAAEDAGLVRIGDGRVRFEHPLVAAAVYRLAAPVDRRRAHLEIAAALTDPVDADRRAWHLAAAAHAPDEAVAAALEGAADRAQARGGYAAQAQALARAAELSPGDADRARRSVDAAAAAYWSGDSTLAMSLAERAAPLAEADVVLRAATIHRLAIIADWHGRWSDRTLATPALEQLAAEVEPLDRQRAVGLLGVILQRRFQALETRAALELAERRLEMSRDLGEERRMRAVQDLARATGLRGEAERCEALCEQVLVAARASGAIGFATNIAEPLIWLERYDDARRQLEASVLDARAAGNVVRLAFELTNLALLGIRTGAFNRALAAASEARSLASESGNDYLVACNLAALTRLSALRGDDDGSNHQAALALEIASRLRDKLISAEVKMAQGEAALGAGRAADAVALLEPLRELADRNEVGEPGVLQFGGDLVEAYARTGQATAAAEALDWFEARATAVQRRWAMTVAARCRGLLASADEMDPPFAEALERHERDGSSPFQRARTQLLYGERLRRLRRRRDARAQLRPAMETFDRLGAAQWSERARQELAATGESIARRDLTAPERLTPQELQIALQVAEGRANREIAEALFLSPKTVEFHLTRVYRKLDLHSRAQLVKLFGQEAAQRGVQV